jgi:hypothetical protein
MTIKSKKGLIENNEQSKKQTSFLSKLQNRMSEKTGKKSGFSFKFFNSIFQSSGFSFEFLKYYNNLTNFKSDFDFFSNIASPWPFAKSSTPTLFSR